MFAEIERVSSALREGFISFKELSLSLIIFLRVKYPDKRILSWIPGELLCASSSDSLASSTWMEQHLKRGGSHWISFTISIPVKHSTRNRMRLLKTTTLEPLCRRGPKDSRERAARPTQDGAGSIWSEQQAADRRAAGSAGADCDPKDVARMVEDYVIGKKRRTPRHSEPSHPSLHI